MMLKLAFISAVGGAGLIMAIATAPDPASRSPAIAPVNGPAPQIKAQSKVNTEGDHFLFMPAGDGVYSLAGDASATIQIVNE